MKTDLFDFYLPQELIAQKPIFPRDHSRMMVLDRKAQKIKGHFYFYEIEKFLKKGDVLVLNNTKVIPARLYGKKPSGGKVEVLLVRKKEEEIWEALIKGRVKEESTLIFASDFTAEVKEKKDQVFLLEFNKKGKDFFKTLFKIGQTPLPPYIKEKAPLSVYQTIFAQKEGSVAAPTAGFHFTEAVLNKLKKKGVKVEFITLHIGLGTFLPIKTKDLRDHQMHTEWFQISPKTAEVLNQTKKEGGRVIAVGTTAVRTLESAAFQKDDIFCVKSTEGETNLFITPGYQFKFVDGILTNFHLPRSTNLVLVCSFGGYDFIMQAYKEAIKNKYRFYSFGDCMLIL